MLGSRLNLLHGLGTDAAPISDGRTIGVSETWFGEGQIEIVSLDNPGGAWVRTERREHGVPDAPWVAVGGATHGSVHRAVAFLGGFEYRVAVLAPALLPARLSLRSMDLYRNEIDRQRLAEELARATFGALVEDLDRSVTDYGPLEVLKTTRTPAFFCFDPDPAIDALYGGLWERHGTDYRKLHVNGAQFLLSTALANGGGSVGGGGADPGVGGGGGGNVPGGAVDPGFGPPLVIGAQITTDGEILLTWNARAEALKYNIERDDGAGFSYLATATAGSSYLDAAVAAGRSYRYRVNAIRGPQGSEDYSGWSEIVVASAGTGTGGGGGTDPGTGGAVTAGFGPVRNVSSRAVADAIEIVWSARADAAKYNVERNRGTGWAYLTTTSGLLYRDFDVIANEEVAYRVVSIRTDTPGADDFSVPSVSTRTTWRAVGGGGVGNSGGGGRYQLAVVDVTGPTIGGTSVGYAGRSVRISNDANTVGIDSAPTAADGTWSVAVPASLVSQRLKAYVVDATGTHPVSVPFDYGRGDGEPPATGTDPGFGRVQGVVAEPTGANGVRLTWRGRVEATKYNLERRDGAAWRYLTTVEATTYTDTGLASGSSFAYRVIPVRGAQGAEVFGEPSAEATATTMAGAGGGGPSTPTPGTGGDATATSFDFYAFDAFDRSYVEAGAAGQTWLQRTAFGGYTGNGYLVTSPDPAFGMDGADAFYTNRSVDQSRDRRIWLRVRAARAGDQLAARSHGTGLVSEVTATDAMTLGWTWVRLAEAWEIYDAGFCLIGRSGSFAVDRVIAQHPDDNAIPSGPAGLRRP